MGELPLFLFRGKQRDRANGRSEPVRGAGMEVRIRFSRGV